jgi:hypothetical protein
VEVCFTQGAIEHPTLNTAFEPQFDRLLEASFGLSDRTALRYDADLRTRSYTTLTSFSPPKCLKIDLESNRVCHMFDFDVLMLCRSSELCNGNLDKAMNEPLVSRYSPSTPRVVACS